MARERWNYAQKVCVRSAGKLMQQAGLVRAGARVGVAVSGGADSLVLMRVMLERRAIAPFRFELMALHVNPGFDPEAHGPLAQWLAGLGVPAHLELDDHGVRAHQEEGRNGAACFRCSRMRRKRLFELVQRYGLTHLAMGHNAEDLAATFFMNLLMAGRVDGLAMREEFFGGMLTLIRPLLWVEKKDIRKAAVSWGLPVRENPCPSAGASGRSEMEAFLESTWRKDGRLKSNTLQGLLRWTLDVTGKNKY